MSLKDRVRALRRLLRPPGGLVVVRARLDERPDRGGPDIFPLPERPGLVLLTPAGTEDDPVRDLTDKQRARIGPHDQVIIVRYADREIDGPAEEATPNAEAPAG